MNTADSDDRGAAADLRDQAQDVREGVLDRWERELTARAISAGTFDDDQAAAQDAARDRRAVAHRVRRDDAEERHSAAIRVKVEEATRSAGRDHRLPAAGEGESEPWSMSRLIELADRGGSLAETLNIVLSIAMESFGAAAGASASLLIDGRLAPAASTVEWARALDAAQLSAARGPLLDAVAGGAVIDAADLAADPRWRLATAVGEIGRCAVVSAAIVVGGTSEGALTVYTEPGARFDPREVAAARLLAAQVSLAVGWGLERLTHRAQTEAWERGLASRDQIGQAKGILMEQRQLSAEEAFQLMRSTSQRLNTKLRDVAEHVVAHRRLPE